MIDLNALMEKADTDNYYCKHKVRKLQFSIRAKNYGELSTIFGTIHKLELTPYKLTIEANIMNLSFAFIYEEYDKVKKFAEIIINSNISIRSDTI